ncbi:unnamed protein product [Didymodactylos carnosus]|uniref:Uncharacterized protein n=1 Tax=Didymodactylos carnosus TaxID=1234261 RepID=A0A815EXP4_9BILA|nr:unnamed protein product [Didymodactylos carnosus]CAF4150539.1 unnamed protein product [Didymodactylos carnosus]
MFGEVETENELGWSCHNKVAMIQTLRAGKCESVKQILHIPTTSAKYLSPLDNPLWHSIKQFIRNRHPLTVTDIPLLLSEAFYSLSKEEIKMLNESVA